MNNFKKLGKDQFSSFALAASEDVVNVWPKIFTAQEIRSTTRPMRSDNSSTTTRLGDTSRPVDDAIGTRYVVNDIGIRSKKLNRIVPSGTIGKYFRTLLPRTSGGCQVVVGLVGVVGELLADGEPLFPVKCRGSLKLSWQNLC